MASTHNKKKTTDSILLSFYESDTGNNQQVVSKTT